MMGTLGRGDILYYILGGHLPMSVPAQEKLRLWHWWALTWQKGEVDLIFVVFIEASPVPFLLSYGETEA